MNPPGSGLWESQNELGLKGAYNLMVDTIHNFKKPNWGKQKYK